MAKENKTKETDASVTTFLNTIGDEQKKKDSFELLEILKQATGNEPKMWGTSIIGFGSYHYKYESGREGDTCIIGLSPRKQNIVLYGLAGSLEADKLGKYKTGKGCLYINRLDDVNKDVLKKMIKTSFQKKTK